MAHNNKEHDESTPSLSTALNDLYEQTVRIQDDMVRVKGILDNISGAKNAYELHHRLISLLGRERSTTKMLRRWVALLEPIDKIAQSIGSTNG